MIKGIVLAGEAGNSLLPVTMGIPKQLLPIYDKPMVYYPIATLVEAGITEILLVTSPIHQDLFRQYLGNGSNLGCKITYATQSEPHGIAEALTIGADFIDKDGVTLITGDTLLIGGEVKSYLLQAQTALKKSGSASVFTYREYDTEQYGSVIESNGKRMIVDVSKFQSSFPIVGMYVYPSGVSEIANTISPSARGLLEITSVNQCYLDMNRLQILQIDKSVRWLDTRTFDDLLTASSIVRSFASRHI